MLLTGFFDYIAKDGSILTNPPYTATHQWIMVIITFILAILIVVFKDKLKSWKHIDLFITIMGYVLIVNAFAYYVWIGAHGHFNGIKTLPLTFCPMTAIITGIVLVTRKYFLFPYAFYMGIFGGLMSLLIPDDLHASPVNFRFYHFYLQHSGIILMPIMVAVVYDKLPTFKDTLRGYYVMAAVGLNGLIFNIINDWETKYAELNPYKPVAGTPLEWVSNWTNQSWIALTITGAVVMFGVFMLIYALSHPKQVIKKKVSD